MAPLRWTKLQTNHFHWWTNAFFHYRHRRPRSLIMPEKSQFHYISITLIYIAAKSKVSSGSPNRNAHFVQLSSWFKMNKILCQVKSKLKRLVPKITIAGWRPASILQAFTNFYWHILVFVRKFLFSIPCHVCDSWQMLLQLWLIIYLHDLLKRETWTLFLTTAILEAVSPVHCKNISAYAGFVSVHSEGGSETKEEESLRELTLTRTANREKKIILLCSQNTFFSTIIIVKIQNLNKFK